MKPSLFKQCALQELSAFQSFVPFFLPLQLLSTFYMSSYVFLHTPLTLMADCSLGLVLVVAVLSLSDNFCTVVIISLAPPSYQFPPQCAALPTWWAAWLCQV